MSHPAHIRRIAVNLLLPPISLDTSSVAAALEIPYQTIHKWKKDAIAAQATQKRRDKSTPTSIGSERALRIKNDPSIAASQPTRTHTRPNEHINALSTEGGYAKKSSQLVKSMPLSMFSP
jgi:hypothetical protein